MNYEPRYTLKCWAGSHLNCKAGCACDCQCHRTAFGPRSPPGIVQYGILMGLIPPETLIARPSRG
jgi:hypothetical protein